MGWTRFYIVCFYIDFQAQTQNLNFIFIYKLKKEKNLAICLKV